MLALGARGREFDSPNSKVHIAITHTWALSSLLAERLLKGLWSRGMMLALGARGREFDSPKVRNSAIISPTSLSISLSCSPPTVIKFFGSD